MEIVDKLLNHSRLALSNAEIPIGVVTATIGAPVFIYLLIRHQGSRR